MATPRAEEPLRALHVLEYPYRRSLGPVLGRFFTALRDRRLVGIRTRSGQVIVPPAEYDPQTSEPLTEFVDVGPEGEVVSWCWVSRPRKKQPLDRPFAYALIRLDGADAPLLHAVDAGGASQMRTGLRVRPRWAAETTGSIRDIACFEPSGDAVAGAEPPGENGGEPPEPVRSITTPVRLEYDVTAGRATSRFLRALAEGKILGARVRPGEPVYVPPRGADPRTAELTEDMVEVAHEGTVVTFSIVRVPSENIAFELPYVCVNVLLDGAGIPFFHVLQNCPLEEVRIGMRVRAVWADPLVASVDSIRYFEPNGEPDVPFEQLQEHT